MAQERLLGLLAPHDTGGDHRHQAGEVPSPGMGIEGHENRRCERVAHDGDDVHPLSSDRVEQLDDVELTTLQGRDAASEDEGGEGGEQSGPVHEGAGGEKHRRHAQRCDRLADRRQPAVDGVAHDVGRVEQGEKVVLAPHHALRGARRATGVEQAQVVAAATARQLGPRIGCRPGRARRGLVVDGEVRARAGAVVDVDPRLHLREVGSQPRDAIGEAAVKDDRRRVGVVPEEHQLLGAVAVIRVDGHEARLHRGEDGLEVLVAVVEVLGDLVLALEAGVG